jgi:hypothetical protein
MTLPPRIDDARRKVWIAFAEHFLDTETRQELPLSALAAVEAGFSVEEAREIWQYEVTPAVGFNGWCVAGEWAAWGDDWLLERTGRIASRRRSRPSLASYLLYRLTVHFGHGIWVAIERLMRALLAVEAGERRALAEDLAALAQHYFDFLPRDLGLQEPGRRERLRNLFDEVFLPAMRCAVVRVDGRTKKVCAARVEGALRGQDREAHLPPEPHPIAPI